MHPWFSAKLAKLIHCAYFFTLGEYEIVSRMLTTLVLVEGMVACIPGKHLSTAFPLALPGAVHWRVALHLAIALNEVFQLKLFAIGIAPRNIIRIWSSVRHVLQQ